MPTLKISHGIGGSAGLHPYYEDLMQHVPEEIDVVEQQHATNYWKKKGTDTPSVLLRCISGVVNAIGMPNIWPAKTKANILYCCQHLPITSKDWILDIDHPVALVRYKHHLQYALFARLLTTFMINRKRCRAIIFWSKAAKTAFCNMFPNLPETTLQKMHVIYPSFVLEKKKPTTGPYKLVFVSNMFHQKGGGDLLEAFKRYQQKNKQATLTVIGNVDEESKVQYRDCGIIFKDRMPRSDVYSEYRKADVFVYPTKMEIFGLVILEALSFQLPVITTDDFCTTELVQDNKTGVILSRAQKNWFDEKKLMNMNCDFTSDSYQQFVHNRDETLITNLIAAMGRLADPKEREKLRTGIETGMHGFDPKKRKELLQKIFDTFKRT